MPYKKSEAQVAYQKEWYKKNKSKHYQQLVERRKKNVDWLNEYKSTLSCIKCGESHVACLDFHHRERTSKKFDVYYGTQQGASREKVLEEIAKCDVLCANCHRKLHWEERKENPTWTIPLE